MKPDKKTQHASPINKGIILEGSFMHSFMYHALKEKLITPLFDPKELPEGPDVEIPLFKNSKKRDKVLDLCLLYDNIYLYDEFGTLSNKSTRYYDQKKLQQYYITTYIEPTEPADYWTRYGLAKSGKEYLRDDHALILKSLKPIVLPFLRREYPLINNSTYDSFINILTLPEFSRYLQHSEVDFAVMEALLSISQEGKKHKINFKNMRGNKFEKLSQQVIYEIEASAYIAFFMLQDILKGIYLLEHSANMRIPIASPLISKSSKPLEAVNSHQYTTGFSENYYKVFQIVLDEIEYFPKVNSMEDVFRLREDKRIADFRENLQNWTYALQVNDFQLEKKLRTQVRKSNKALKIVSDIKRIGAIITYVSLPLSVVPFLGLPLGVIGTGFQLYSDIVEWQNRWLMVGK